MCGFYVVSMVVKLWRWIRAHLFGGEFCKFQWWLNGKWGVEIDFHQRFTSFQHLTSICWALRTNLYGSPNCLGVFSWKLWTVYYSKWSTLVVLVGHFCWYWTCWMNFTWRGGSVFFLEQYVLKIKQVDEHWWDSKHFHTLWSDPFSIDFEVTQPLAWDVL